jgi:hypothetical protein
MIHYPLKLIKEISHHEDGIGAKEIQLEKDQIPVDKIYNRKKG